MTDRPGASVGALIFAKRTELGISQAEAGRQMGGAKQGTVSKWETGALRPELANIPAVARFLGINRGELLEMITDEKLTANPAERRAWARELLAHAHDLLEE